jgi:phosphopantothenoylcysteine decarboxylase/phosphopantothenate--cysteine ligase
MEFILAWQSPEIREKLRSFHASSGFEVQCLLSAGGEKFIPRLVLETLSGKSVPSGLWADDISGTEHIRLAREADLILFAPATAHLIARLSLGLADDLIWAKP